MDNLHNESDNFGLGAILGIGAIAKKAWYKVKKPVPKKATSTQAAQKISDSGGYLTLTPEQKSLIPVPSYILMQEKNKALQNANPLPMTSGQMVEKVKNYLPYIIGSIVLIIIVVLLIKRK